MLFNQIQYMAIIVKAWKRRGIDRFKESKSGLQYKTIVVEGCKMNANVTMY